MCRRIIGHGRKLQLTQNLTQEISWIPRLCTAALWTRTTAKMPDMKRLWALPLLLLLLGSQPAKRASAQIEDLPTKPWTPPRTTVSPEVVETAAFLLSHGMGDPRGGSF